MRRFFFYGLIVLLIAGCDKVEDPFDVENPGGGGVLIPGSQKVLIEDLTGFRCTNCPEAADIAHNLSEVYGEQLIVVGVHCSNTFAAPTGTPPNEPFSTDFRTTAGTAYWEAYGSPGLPRGMVNRRQIDETTIILPQAWGERADLILQETAKAAVVLEDLDYNSNSREVTFNVNMATADGLDPGAYFMTLYLIEDSIIDDQLFPGGEHDPNYLHRHVLRDNINGTWGDLAFSDGSVGQENTLGYQYTLDEAWKEEHCEIVAYIYNADTREIVQADKALVMNP